MLSLRLLERHLKTSRSRLHEIADNVAAHYNTFPQKNKKNPSKVRMITAPEKELKAIQARIAGLLTKIPLNASVHGGVRGKSPRTNAEPHLGQRFVVNVDVRDFFPSIRHTAVYRMLRRDFGWGSDVARLVTRLTTLKGTVPQGAPTSTVIANLFLSQPVDGIVSSHAQRLGAASSRFVDDLTFSGLNPAPLVQIAGKQLSTRGLQIHRKKARFQPKAKLKITPNWQRQEVTG
jgi:hypothetical protein